MSESQPNHLSALVAIARDLTSSLTADDRYERLLAAVRRAIPCDAACLLRLEGDELVPLAGHGLADEALVRRYPRQEHPRLDIIISSSQPVRFPIDSTLPDPFDGLLASDPHALEHIHACLGAPLLEGGEIVGALTADALSPQAFDELDPRFLEALGALAGAALRTTSLIESLQQVAERKGEVVRELQRSSSRTPIVGRSAASGRLVRDISIVASSDLPVLISGETGVGKELVAQQIHRESARREEPLIQVNCAALPESIAESELFGHVAGSFTGAVRDRAGKFELADGATLFLDEVGELPLTLQPKLLRALQQGEVQRVGDDRAHHVDVRVIAATNRDLASEVTAGRFRADLYHRLAVYPLRVPPLRERRDDIALLAAHFLDETRRRLGTAPLRLAPDARDLLTRAYWPGNVRELENVLNRVALRCAARAGAARTGDTDVIVIQANDLDISLNGEAASSGDGETSTVSSSDGAGDMSSTHRSLTDLAPAEVLMNEVALSLKERTQEFQRRVIVQAVRQRKGNWAAAARDLGMHRSNLYHLARRLGLREE